MTDSRAQTANFSWNPFVRIEGDDHAAGLARGGVWAAGLVGLSYVLTVAPIVFSGRFDDRAGAIVASAAIAVALAAALGWWVHAKASAIAAGLLAVWIAAETAGGLWLAAQGLDAARALGTLVDVFSLILAVQSWRGAWTLRRAPAAA